MSNIILPAWKRSHCSGGEILQEKREQPGASDAVGGDARQGGTLSPRLSIILSRQAPSGKAAGLCVKG